MDFQVGSWLVRPEIGTIGRAGAEASHITPKSMSLLVCLARRKGQILTKEEIFQEVWPDTFVTDDALTRCIRELRRAFHDDARHPATIGTIAKRGYRILAPVIWTSDHAIAPLKRIAVLPLTDLSGNPEHEYFADGMTEELITELAQIQSWRVISRTSVMRYKGTKQPLPEIARDLSADAIIEGTVLQAGTRIRITTQLIDAATDTHLWSNSFERELSDVLWLQREIGQAVAAQLRIEFGTVRGQPPRQVNPAAYEAYLRGMFHLGKFTPDGFERGMRYLQLAVEQDPSNPSTYSALALGYAIVGHDRFPDAFQKARAAAIRSLDLGGPSAEAYTVLAMIEIYWDWDIEAAGRDFRRALEQNPSLSEARRNYSWYLRLLGKPGEAIQEMEIAASLDPLSPQIAADLAWHYLFEGDFDAAIGAAEKSLESNPTFAQGLAILGWSYVEKGNCADAIALQQRAAETAAWKWPLGRTYALLGRNAEALAVAAELEKDPGPMDQWGLGVIYSALGDCGKAMHWLQAAHKSRFSWMPWNAVPAVPSQDVFANLRHDRRFQDLLRSSGS